MKNKNLFIGALVVAVLVGIVFYAINQSNSSDLQGAFPGPGVDDVAVNSGSIFGPGASAACDGLVLEIDGGSQSISDGSMSDLYDAVEEGCEIRVVATSSSVDQHLAFNCVEIELGETTSKQDFVDCTGGAYLSYDGSELMSKNFEYTIDSDGSTDLILEDLSYDASGGDSSSWSTGRTFSVYAR
jgi:hypothetical protein